jgi:hypothetical protein
MNYHALLLVDKNRKYRNNKSLGISNSNQYSFTSHKINNQLNTHENQKYKKCFSVKPSLYSMPKDILLKDLFQNSMKILRNISINLFIIILVIIVMLIENIFLIK